MILIDPQVKRVLDCVGYEEVKRYPVVSAVSLLNTCFYNLPPESRLPSASHSCTGLWTGTSFATIPASGFYTLSPCNIIVWHTLPTHTLLNFKSG